jgi:hypothetical protein
LAPPPGGLSLLKAAERPSYGNIEHYKANPDQVARAVPALRDMGFDVTLISPFAISAKVQRRAFEQAFATKLSVFSQRVHGLHRETVEEFYYPADGAGWAIPAALASLIDDAYIQWPPIRFQAPSPFPPRVDYFHLRVPGDVALASGILSRGVYPAGWLASLGLAEQGGALRLVICGGGADLVDAGGRYVCETCVEDPALQAVVRETAIADECDYCKKKSDQPIATEVAEVAGFILNAVEKEFVDPANELPYETQEGGYQGDVIDNPGDLFEEIGFSLENEQLVEDLADCLGANVWLCKKNYYSCTPSERMQFGWERFKTVVKHQRRYTFWSGDDDGPSDFDPDYLPTSKMLAELADIMTRVGLIRQLPIGTEMWRVRVHEDGVEYTAASDFSSPPIEKARFANRMSPAGVPMFYGSQDFDTAAAESIDPSGKDVGKIVSGARFTTLVPLNVLDLVSLPETPSFFSSNDSLRHALYFLRSFTYDLSQPIVKDGREHIDYVPTQVLTEFVRYELKTTKSEPVHGVSFPSSRNRQRCFVIFAEQVDCLDDVAWRRNPQLLQFTTGSIRRQVIRHRAPKSTRAVTRKCASRPRPNSSRVDPQ